MADNQCNGTINGYTVTFPCSNTINFSPTDYNQFEVSVPDPNGSGSFTLDLNSGRITNNSPMNIYMPELIGKNLTFSYSNNNHTHFSHYTVDFDNDSPANIISANAVISNAQHAENPAGHSPMLSPNHPLNNPNHPLNNPNHPLNNPNHPLNRRLNAPVESFKNVHSWDFWNWLWFLIIVLVVVYLIYYFVYKKKTIDLDL